MTQRKTVAKFWLVAQPPEPADLQPAAGAQPRLWLPSREIHGKADTDRGHGDTTTSVLRTVKKTIPTPPAPELPRQGELFGEFFRQTPLKYVGTLFTWMQLPGRGDIITCPWKSGVPQLHSKHKPRPLSAHS